LFLIIHPNFPYVLYLEINIPVHF